ncbi:hypothetical protein SYNPS1DRAFT_26898 [Syncephalis pseudoplumigaleata]|uniref:Protein kinase domain-containing protein n=1 Tax=Syncephalis pseudoplumigaleata TaxID=1712513 RepID=A0A4P9Z4E2_9FUNG|nr:hypothetical protein SYNPS1DRAFT_26898 [Syncephalis pseudoplumigaleata]|eukprot:RKP27443.1 hypothetical protein SYNPS1DRAFT_26898 [Syncephalis pseudoplumigaleata]
MDNASSAPFGTPAPVNRRRSNIVAARSQLEKRTPARTSNSFRKQLFQDAVSKAAADDRPATTTTTATAAPVDFELGTPMPRRHADTPTQMDMTPASISRRLSDRPSFLTPRLVKPDAKAFNSTGLMSKKKTQMTTTMLASATTMLLSDDPVQSPHPSRMMVGVPDTPCKRSPAEYARAKELPSAMLTVQQTPKPPVRSFLKHALPLSSGGQERVRKRLHVDEAEDDNAMLYSPEYPSASHAATATTATTPPITRTAHVIPSSPVRDSSFIREAPSPTPSGSESPLTSTRHYTHRPARDAMDMGQNSNSSNNVAIAMPDTPPQQHADGANDAVHPPSSPCVWHDANEEVLLSQEDPLLHPPPANSLLHRLVTARNTRESISNREELAVEKKSNQLIVNDYTTRFAHFLRASYFEQLDQEQGQTFVVPATHDGTDDGNEDDVCVDYFNSQFTIVRTLGCGEFSEAFAAHTSSSDEQQQQQQQQQLYAVKRTKFPFSGVRDRARQLQEIGDFGMAAFYPTKRSDEREGDREYMAPEILRGEYGRPADIFSLGLIILEMAINVVMPDNGVAWQKLRADDFSDCDFSTVSDSLAGCIRRMLTAAPDARPTIDRVLEEPEIRRAIEAREQ